uniref:Uncharacterized protein AlNc14C207G8835 n=1 Tax=Albugo laibachii Nc14 TaxID=890382 RepID=F0WR27_9STRA|nr:conserved hypothetical protein [Albugo laibachii Nc14]|eukprot:CCA23787.1 conserved hypothetical protein [Albugo laibachii Nc14]
MATSELAAILARRRAKDGSSAFSSSSDRGETPSETMPSIPGKSSSELPSYLPSKTLQTADINKHSDLSTTPSHTKEQAVRSTAPLIQKSSRDGSKVQQLKQNLAGIAINQFRPGAAPPRKFGGGESIMTTGEEYGRTHAMGIAMPGMGSAIPMPGLAKMGVRIPGFAHASSESREEADSASNTADDMTHDMLTRAVGPKRRAPTSRTAAPIALPGLSIPSNDSMPDREILDTETGKVVVCAASPDDMIQESTSGYGESATADQLNKFSPKSDALESRDATKSAISPNKLGNDYAEMSSSNLFGYDLSNPRNEAVSERIGERNELLPITTQSDQIPQEQSAPSIQSPKEPVQFALPKRNEPSSESDWSEDDDDAGASSLFGYSNMEPEKEDKKPSVPSPLSPSFSPESPHNASILFGNDTAQSPQHISTYSKTDKIEDMQESAGTEESPSSAIEAHRVEAQSPLKNCSAAYICDPPIPIFGIDYSDEESFEESDDEGGLFGTGFPTSI